MTRSQLLLGLVTLAVIVLGVAAYFTFFGGPASDTAPSTAQVSYTIGKDDRTLGSPKAPVTMIEYAATTCPICARFNNDVFPQVKQHYVDTGKIFYVFRVFPLQAADIAAEAIARCMPPEGYFTFIDLLFRNQSRWDPDGYQIPDVHAALLDMAKTGGMSAGKADSCINDRALTKRIEQVGLDAQTRYGVSGTPTFIINGQIRGPFVDFQDFQSFVDPILRSK